MKIAPGQILRSVTGKTLKILDFIEEGGQGRVFKAKVQETNQDMVVKVFLPSFNRTSIIKRTQLLISLNLPAKCATLKTPIDMILEDFQVAHCSPFVRGKLLDDYLTNPAPDFLSNLILAVALCHSVAVLHEQNIVHGDLQARNVMVGREKGIFAIFMIDFDNFTATGLPLPDCLGHQLYMAPELWDALQKKKNKNPDMYTDRYSLAVLLHEILLLKHPLSGADYNEKAFREAVYTGKWLHDPVYSLFSFEELGGYPPQILNAEVAQLFRKAFSLNPMERPTAKNWEVTLCKMLNQVYLCPACSCPCMIDASKTRCPLCQASYPLLQMVLPGSKTIALDQSRLIGRKDFAREAMSVSEKHAIIKRNGPETIMIPMGRYGTYRKDTSGSWRKLQDNTPVVLQDGDCLKMANQEVKIVRTSAKKNRSPSLKSIKIVEEEAKDEWFPLLTMVEGKEVKKDKSFVKGKTLSPPPEKKEEPKKSVLAKIWGDLFSD